VKGTGGRGPSQGDESGPPLVGLVLLKVKKSGLNETKEVLQPQTDLYRTKGADVVKKKKEGESWTSP